MTKKLKLGEIYRFDKRFTYVSIFKEIKYQDFYKNFTTSPNNFQMFEQNKKTNTVILVLKHELIFNREFVKLLITDGLSNKIAGLMTLNEFLSVACGKIKYLD